MMLSVSSSCSFSRRVTSVLTAAIADTGRCNCSMTLLSFSRSLIANHLFWSASTASPTASSTFAIAFSTFPEKMPAGFFHSFFFAASIAFSTTSLRPVPFNAEVSTTSQPKISESFFTSILSPLFASRSAMFNAITTGIPISRIWVVRYKFLSMFVASTRLMIACGFS